METKTDQTVLTIKKTLKTINCTFKAKKVKGHDQKTFPAQSAGRVPPLSNSFRRYCQPVNAYNDVTAMCDWHLHLAAPARRLTNWPIAESQIRTRINSKNNNCADPFVRLRIFFLRVLIIASWQFLVMVEMRWLLHTWWRVIAGQCCYTHVKYGKFRFRKDMKSTLVCTLAIENIC